MLPEERKVVFEGALQTLQPLSQNPSQPIPNPPPTPLTVNRRSPFSLGPPSAGGSFHSGRMMMVGRPMATRGSL